MLASITPPLTDQQLVERFRATSDKRYFGVIYERYHDKVYHCCLGILKQETQANDLTQDIMLIVLENLPQLRNGSLLSFWIYRISKNAALKAAKTGARQRTDEISEAFDYVAEEDGGADLMETEMKLAFVRRALRELKPADREIVELKYLQDASVRDLQLKTGLSMSAIKMRLLRARQQIMNTYQERHASNKMIG